MNLVAAITELQDRYGADALSSARCTILLNEAQVRFEDWGQVEWPWLKATATGPAPLTIADLRRVLQVTDTTNKNPLVPVAQADIPDFFDPDMTTTGVPGRWYLTSDTVIATYPVQAASLSVPYLRFSPELSGSATPLIPARYHAVWVDLAGVIVLEDRGDGADAQSLQGRVDQRLEQIAAVYAMMDAPHNDAMLMTGASVDG